MPRKSLDEAKAELIACAVGANEYTEITTWEELAEGAAAERLYASDRASRLQSLLTQAENEMEGEYDDEDEDE